MHPYSFIDQVIMSYGGLRGAVAYGLVMSLPTEHIPIETKKMFVTTIEMTVLFTVFVQVRLCSHQIDRIFRVLQSSQ
jgi:NhaP-type Na+/H+ or K+/H+ antiporter